MKKQFSVLTLIFLLFCFACQRKTPAISGITEIKIDRNLAKDYQLSEAISIKKYVPLETNDSCLLGQIIKIKYHDSCFYINSRFTDLYRFSSDGIFMNSIGRHGRGPEEFQFVLDFDIITGNKQVEILCTDQRRLKTFTVNGEFYSSQPVEIRNGSISRISNGQHFVYIRNSNYTGDDIKNQYVLFLVEDLRYPERMTPVIPLYNRYLDLSGGLENFWQNNEETLFHYGYNDTIYQFSESKIEHKYHVDFGNKMSITELGTIKDRNDAISIISDDLYSGIGKRVFINDDFIYLDYGYRQKNQKYVMNKVSKDELHYTNLLAGRDTIIMEPVLLINDVFISLVDPLQIIAHGDEFIKCGLKKEFVSQLKETQNPIIIYYSYKFGHN